ncbi:MAG: hypothetical protein AAFP04_09805 [Myxococcota bacterium]
MFWKVAECSPGSGKKKVALGDQPRRGLEIWQPGHNRAGSTKTLSGDVYRALPPGGSYPSTGRYLTPDPRGQFGGDLTLFGYAASNPGRYTDAEGESAVADAIPVAIGLAAADGPVLPFGDAAGAVVLASALSVDIALAVVLMNQDNSTGGECSSGSPAAKSPEKGKRLGEGTAKSAQEQLEEIESAQAKVKKKQSGQTIDNIDKSKQRARHKGNRLKDHKDALEEFGDDFSDIPDWWFVD